MAGPRRVPELRFRGFEGEWEEKRLGEVVALSKGRGYSKADTRESGTPILLYGTMYTNYQTVVADTGAFAELNRNAVLSLGNEVVIPASGETAEEIVRASVISQGGMILGGDLNILKPCQDLDSRFLALDITFGEPRKDLTKRAQGKTVVHLHNSDLKEVLFRHPMRDEQSQIGDFFQNLDSAITLHQRRYDKLTTVKTAMLQKLFPQDGADVPEVRFGGFTGKWESSTLGEISTITSGTTPLRSNTAFFEGGTIPWVKTGDLNNSLISRTDECITSLADARINAPGSVLVAMYGGFNQIGRTGYLTVSAATNQAISVLSFHSGRLLPAYGLIWLNARVGDWKKIASSSRKDPNITSADVAKFQVLFPGYDEQQKIAGYFAHLDRLLALQTQRLDKLRSLKKALLAKMFV